MTTPPSAPMLRPASALLIALGVSLFSVLSTAGPVRAQRVVPKLSSLCPLGYVDTLNGKCSTLGLMNYELQPTNGEPCPSGWFDVGGGYCRRK